MICRDGLHYFMWGASTTTDAMPLTLRCQCGSVSRADMDQLAASRAEAEALREHLVEFHACNSWRLAASPPAPAAEIPPPTPSVIAVTIRPRGAMAADTTTSGGQG